MLHTGATSVPAALTRGDLDIHVRVAPAEFSRARDALARVYASCRTEIWRAGGRRHGTTGWDCLRPIVRVGLLTSFKPASVETDEALAR